jgi:DNA mismatch endonuclease (patch repair protein)
VTIQIILATKIVKKNKFVFERVFIMDIWDKEKRSKVMSKIRSKNTNPELTLRKALFAKGFRYRINDKKLPGKPDIVFPKYKTAIFIHGCFWHGHEDCNCKIAHIPKSNVEYWSNKIAKNKKRDAENYTKMQALGWNVITIWECEISKKNIGAILNDISKKLKLTKYKSFKITIYEEIENNIVKVAEDIIAYSPKK